MELKSDMIYVHGSFVSENGQFKGELVLGYDFVIKQGIVSFKRWDNNSKCDNPYRCRVKESQIGLIPSDANCGNSKVWLVWPKVQNTRITCVDWEKSVS